MCRLFGFRSAVPSGAHQSLVQAQDALVRQAERHPDGWGIGWHHGEEAVVVKTANAAIDCERFRQISASLRSQSFIAHLRKATVGRLDHLNAHPFQRGRWLFAHNGSIWGFDDGMSDWLRARTDPDLLPLIVGDTDSERLFYYLLSILRACGADPTGRSPSSAGCVTRAVRTGLAALDAEAQVQGHDRPLTNVLLTDGRLLLAHRAGMPLHLSTQKHHCSDAPTCAAVKVCLQQARPDAPVNHLLVASEPLHTHEHHWEEVVDGTTVVLDEAFRLRFVAPAQGWVAPVWAGAAMVGAVVGALS